MKTCMTCGSPLLSEPDGAAPSSSIQCAECGAPKSSASYNTPHRPIQIKNPKPVTHYQKRNPNSLATIDDHLMISTELLTEEGLPTETTIAELVNIESEQEMDTEVDSQKSEADQKDTLPSPEERAEARKKSLSRQGFVLQEDAHGLRLSGIASRPGGLRSQLSPYDVVRLAAELEGGVVPMEERKRCPKCDAVVNPGDKRCQWCSEIL
jgi:hypothetical protein